MYLLDSNTLRAYLKGHQTVIAHTLRVPLEEIALPSVVAAEALRGRCEYLLKATAEQTQLAENLLQETLRTLQSFQLVTFDQASVAVLNHLLKQHQSRKRHADVMIAALASAGHHIVVTRNTKDFADLLPALQLQNWIDDPPVN